MKSGWYSRCLWPSFDAVGSLRETITVLWRDQQGDLDDHLVEKFEAAHPGLK